MESERIIQLLEGETFTFWEGKFGKVEGPCFIRVYCNGLPKDSPKHLTVITYE